MQKQAIITGGAIRVGKGIALALASQGYDIIIIYNSSASDAEKTAAEIEGLGQKAYIYQCDIARTPEVRKVFAEIFAAHENIKLLVNNASIFEKHDFHETTEEIFDAHFDINLKAPFFISQFYSEYCKKQNFTNAHIVNISDTYTTTNSTAYFAYLMTKKSLTEFTKMVANQLAPNIRVNAVSIGMLLPSQHWDESKVLEKSANAPMAKKSEMKDVTDAIIYLDNSANLTGNNIFVDSGLQLM